MQVPERLSGGNARRIAEFLVGAVYVTAAILEAFLLMSPGADVVPEVIAAVAWIVMVVWCATSLWRSDRRREDLAAWAPIIVLIASGIPLVLRAPSWIFVVMAIAAWILFIRQMAEGSQLWFAVSVVVGVTLLAGVGMGYYESRDGIDNGINDVFDALVWAGATFTRLDTYLGDPETANGKAFGLMIIFCGGLFAWVLLSWLTTAILGEKQTKARSAEQLMLEATIERTVRQAIADALGEATGQPLPQRAPVLWIDNDSVVGRGWKGLWAYRRDLTRDLLMALSAVPRARWEPLLPPGHGDRSVVIVLEGEAREVQTPLPESCVISASIGEGEDLILAQSREGDRVVTADARLRSELTGRGIEVLDVTVIDALIGAAPTPA